MRFNKNNDIVLRDEGVFGFFSPFLDDFFNIPSHKECKVLDRAMKTDIMEKDKEYEMQVELPGFDKKDIKMHLENGYLTVEAQKSESSEQKDEKDNIIRSERKFGSCSRSFYVGEVQEEDIRARLEQGILTIEVPKETQKINPKKYIEIK